MAMVARLTKAGATPQKAGHPCASCEGRLLGHERDWLCDGCVRDWRTWQRNQREADRRFVAGRMGPDGWRRIREGVE